MQSIIDFLTPTQVSDSLKENDEKSLFNIQTSQTPKKGAECEGCPHQPFRYEENEHDQSSIVLSEECSQVSDKEKIMFTFPSFIATGSSDTIAIDSSIETGSHPSPTYLEEKLLDGCHLTINPEHFSTL